MVQITSAFLILASGVVSCTAATISDVQKDFTALLSNATSFNSALSSFTSATWLSSGIPVFTDTVNLITSLDQATADIKTLKTPLSAADANTLVNAIQPLSTGLPKALKAVGASKAQILGIPAAGNLASGAVSGVVVAVRSSVQNLEAALLAALPAAQKSKVTSIKTTVDAAFTSVLAMYESGICS